MSTIGIAINDIIAACAGSALTLVIMAVITFHSKRERDVIAEQNMTNSRLWKRHLKRWIDGLDNVELNRMIDDVDIPDIPSICKQCESENGRCRVDGYPCPFTLDKGIDDYMNTKVRDWSFRSYIGVYLAAQRALDYSKTIANVTDAIFENNKKQGPRNMPKRPPLNPAPQPINKRTI